MIYNSYNATEAGMIATATPHDLRAAPDTAGKPLGGVDIRILDEERRELSTCEVGGIFALSELGRLFVVGRDDEMIVSGGENVYRLEVEKNLVAHPDVAEASVLGVDDQQYGQRLPRNSTGKILRKELLERVGTDDTDG